ncbi:uncharacterized protein [Mycetomoellerius zeteki]|uniref:uncharacterized protein n=1 Tax=Mycetomoellerius zeteki TaxID=64791 RepID=UPI00084E6777|nr:PREDICTED: uncharacterized protein LOC108725434 [Trachymyrmex zeteki]
MYLILSKAKPPPPNITRQERLALQDLNRDTDIIVLPANKGNTTVVINTSDYKKKMKNFLSDKAYKKLDKDPTNTIAQKTKTLVEESNVPSKTKSTLKPANPLPPRLYGLPKVHKPNIPFRPIVSAIYSPTHSLSRFLAQTLQPLTGKTESCITNSTDFIKKIRLHPTDLLISFDVESLFTQVPIKDTLNIIKASHKVPFDLIPLIEHCLTTTYFSYNNQFYEQTSGAAMGSPISPVIANIFMEHFEKEALGKTPKKPEVWFRYVDDTFVIWRHGRADLRKFLIFLNKQHPNSHFTMDIEENGKLPFLDVLVSKKADGTLGYHQVYRKPTHTDRNNRPNRQDIKQTQHPNYLQTIQKDTTNLKKSQRSKTSTQLRRSIQNTLLLRASIHRRNRENGQPTDKRTPTRCQAKTRHAVGTIRTQYRNRTSNTVR